MNRFLTYDDFFNDNDLINGTVDIRGNSLTADNLSPNEFIITDVNGIMISSPTLDIQSLDITDSYKINGNIVLTETNLGTGVVNSSLTSVGNLVDLTVVGNLIVDTDTLVVNATTNKVGINISNPGQALAVGGNISISGGFTYKIGGNDVLSNNTLSSSVINSSLTSVGTLVDLTITGDLHVKNNLLFVKTSNNAIGINNGNPNSALDIGGDINISGLIRKSGSLLISDTSLGTSVINSSLTSVGSLVDLTVIGDIIGSSYNTGTNVLGGHVCCYSAEMAGNITVARYFSYGDSSDNPDVGFPMPYSGKIVSWLVKLGSDSTCTFRLRVDNQNGGNISINSLNLTSEKFKQDNSLNRSFNAGEIINLSMTSGSVVNNGVVGTFYVIFD